ncbi:MAG: SAM-dependent methyltransferase, partial [Acidobacteriota bacterium]|nr:SAM-dependent methyltransferase [Acidobacteriota bacterium]
GARARANGPLTFAEYMELALYHPELGYYARAGQRSGRAGDFFTSVDVGAVFGELLARQFVEMWSIVDAMGNRPGFDIVEAGAGNGRLSRDILDAATRTPRFYDAIRLHLSERSKDARRKQADVLGPHADKIASSRSELPDGVRGVIFANELLDAFPVHRIEMTVDGLCEINMDTDGDRLVERLQPVQTPAVLEYLERLGVALPLGSRAEINLLALAWIRTAAKRLRQGFIVLIDYGDDASQLYGAARRHGTLAAYRRHTQAITESEWRDAPGDWDLTSNVDWTSVTRCAEHHGLRCLGLLDQTYFLLGLGGAEIAASQTGDGLNGLKRRLAAKTLLMPGGLGSTHKVMIYGKNVGSPALRGSSYGMRVT